MILCIAAGVLCGLAAVAFHLSIHGLFQFVWRTAESAGAYMPLILILAPALGGLIVGLILWKVAPAAGGSGIPQTKAAYYNNFGIIQPSQGVWRFILGTIYVGMGNSLGREGPTVHMCSAIASGLGQLFGMAKSRIQSLVPVGMGAGIAAAFNAPLSALFFVFEELLDDFSTKALGGIVLAVVIASTVSRLILGADPVLNIDIPNTGVTSWWMLVCIPLGVAAAFIGDAFVKALLASRARMKVVNRRFPIWMTATAGGLVMGVIGLCAYYATGLFGEPQSGVFSIGYESLTQAFEARLAFWVLLILFVVKFGAVLLCYSTGGSGGLFSPTLFLGGMLGGMFGIVLFALHQQFGWFDISSSQQVIGSCVLLGMGALFASIIRCPLTSLLIIYEMTRQYELILPLMIGNIISYYLASRLQRVPLYNALLLQDGISLRKMPAYRGVQDYRNLPVAAIMTHEAVSVRATLTAAAALAQLQASGKAHHGYPLVDEQGALVTVVTHSEIQAIAARGQFQPLGQMLATRKAVTVTPDTSIHSAAALMIKEGVLQVPVVSEKDPKRLLGILTLHDIARQQNVAGDTI